jgi:predicted  nucleic acid-binding Zn-ribbon protein
VNEAAEIKYRMDSITSMLSNSKKNAQTLKAENDQLKQQIHQLEEQLQAASSRQAASSSRSLSVTAEPPVEDTKIFDVCAS